MEKLNLIIALSVLFITLGLYIWTVVKNALERKELKEKIKSLESEVLIKRIPEYVKHYDNSHPRVYKIIDIMLLPQNELYHHELCCVVTCKAKDGATFNATIDKFISATKREYLANKRDELNF